MVYFHHMVPQGGKSELRPDVDSALSPAEKEASFGPLGKLWLVYKATANFQHSPTFVSRENTFSSCGSSVGSFRESLLVSHHKLSGLVFV